MCQVVLLLARVTHQTYYIHCINKIDCIIFVKINCYMKSEKLVHLLLGESIGDGACLYRSLVKSIWYRIFGEELGQDQRTVVGMSYKHDEVFSSMDQFIETVLTRWLRWSLHLFASSHIPVEHIFSDGFTNCQELSQYRLVLNVKQLSETWYLTRINNMNKVVDYNDNQPTLIPFLVLLIFIRQVQTRYCDSLMLSSPKVESTALPFNQLHFESLNYLLNPIYLPNQLLNISRTILHDNEIIDLASLKREAIRTHFAPNRINAKMENSIDNMYQQDLNAWGGSEELELLNLFLHKNKIGFSMELCEVFLMDVDGNEKVVFNSARSIEYIQSICVFLKKGHYVPAYWISFGPYQKDGSIVPAFGSPLIN